MFSAARNNGLVFFQMMNTLPHLKPSIKNELNSLLEKIKIALSTGGDVKTKFDILLPQIFNFRIKALKWLTEDGSIDFTNAFDNAYPQFEKLSLNPRLQVLAENILFALRCNKRIVDVFLKNVPQGHFDKDILHLPEITYNDFVASVVYGSPDNEFAQKFVDWVNSSLYIELITVAAVIIDEKNINISEVAINDIAFLIADAAQDHIALATMLGLLPQRTYKGSIVVDTLDNTFIGEQKGMADLGLDDFSKNFY